MSYTRPAYNAADATWQGADAYTRPAYDAADATWMPQGYGNTASSFAASLLGVSATNTVASTSSSFASGYQYSAPILGDVASSFASSYQYSSPTIGNVPSSYVSDGLYRHFTLYLPETASSFAAPGVGIVAQQTPAATASVAQVGQLVLATHLGGVPSTFTASPLSVEASNNLTTTAPSFAVNPPYTLNWFQLSSYASAPVVSPLSMPDDAPLDATASAFVSTGHAFHGYTAVAPTTSSYASSALGLDTGWTLAGTESSAAVSPLATQATTPLASYTALPASSPAVVRSFNELLSRASTSASGAITHTPGPISVALASTPSRFDAPYLVVRYGRFPVFSAMVSDAILLTSEPGQWVTQEITDEELYMDVVEQSVYAHIPQYQLYYRPPLEVVFAEEREWQVQP